MITLMSFDNIFPLVACVVRIGCCFCIIHLCMCACPYVCLCMCMCACASTVFQGAPAEAYLQACLCTCVQVNVCVCVCVQGGGGQICVFGQRFSKQRKTTAESFLCKHWIKVHLVSSNSATRMHTMSTSVCAFDSTATSPVLAALDASHTMTSCAENATKER